MTTQTTFTAVAKSEWIKFRSVRSTVMGVLVMFVLTIGLGALITSAIRSHWGHMRLSERIGFSPVTSSLAGVSLAQFAVGVIGALFITNEYSSGSIRSTLAAVPNRIRVIVAKVTVLIAITIVVTEIAAFATFFLGQAIYRGVVPTASLATPGVLRAVLLTGLYLTLASLLGFGLGLILRHSAAAISTFTSVVLILPIIVLFLPSSWQNAFSKYEPSSLGQYMRAVHPPANGFGPGTATALFTLYVVVVIVIGVVLLERRDA